VIIIVDDVISKVHVAGTFNNRMLVATLTNVFNEKLCCVSAEEMSAFQTLNVYTTALFWQI